MHSLPKAFTDRIEVQLKDHASEFISSLQNSSSTSVRLNPFKTDKVPFPDTENIGWTKWGYYLKDRPSFTFDPLFHAGLYYVQESSSMFIEQAFRQHVPDEPLRVLDLCAAPGGKSTHLLSLLNKESFLVSNEVINARASVLSENLVRWGQSNYIVTNNDPEHFSDFENCFDVVLVDAPCSGEGMFRKDPDAISEWSEENVKLCSARQRRIVDTAGKLLRPGGILLYSTCTFSADENEEQIKRLLADDKFNSLAIAIDHFPEIVETHEHIGDKDLYGYRFYPHKTKGEGFFLSVLKKTADAAEGKWPKAPKKFQPADKNSIQAASSFIDTGTFSFMFHHERLLAVPKVCADEMFGVLNTSLHIRSFGLELGQVIRDELIPSHALALSSAIKDDLPAMELNSEEAIAYLQKKDIGYDRTKKGWHLVRYQHVNLGWAKLLGSRMNNAYPKEWRIRKES